ncbi:MAG: serine protease [Hellea sp.]
MSEDYSKEEYEMLLEVIKDFKGKRKLVKRAKKVISGASRKQVDSPERVQKFYDREKERMEGSLNRNYSIYRVMTPDDAEAVGDDIDPSLPDTEIAPQLDDAALPDDIDDDTSPIETDPDITLESIINESNDLLSIETLEIGMAVSKSIGLVNVGQLRKGTGFLIGHNLMMTNWHNFKIKSDTNTSSLLMGFEDNDVGERLGKAEYDFDPDRFFYSNKENDVAIVAVKPKSRKGVALEKYMHIPLFEREGKIIIGEPVNIIQHAGGHRKQVVFHNSNLVALSNKSEKDQYCYYDGDTKKGSSGSPVFNKHWEVIALHRKGVPETTRFGKIVLKDNTKIDRSEMMTNMHKIKWASNQGVRISRIIDNLKKEKFESEETELVMQNYKTLRDDLLLSWGVQVLT